MESVGQGVGSGVSHQSFDMGVVGSNLDMGLNQGLNIGVNHVGQDMNLILHPGIAVSQGQGLNMRMGPVLDAELSQRIHQSINPILSTIPNLDYAESPIMQLKTLLHE